MLIRVICIPLLCNCQVCFGVFLDFVSRWPVFVGWSVLLCCQELVLLILIVLSFTLKAWNLLWVERVLLSQRVVLHINICTALIWAISRDLPEWILCVRWHFVRWIRLIKWCSLFAYKPTIGSIAVSPNSTNWHDLVLATSLPVSLSHWGYALALQNSVTLLHALDGVLLQTNWLHPCFLCCITCSFYLFSLAYAWLGVMRLPWLSYVAFLCALSAFELVTICFISIVDYTMHTSPTASALPHDAFTTISFPLG